MQLLLEKENMAIYKEITEVYQIIPGILLHVILGVIGKQRMRSERSRKPVPCPETTSRTAPAVTCLGYWHLQHYVCLRQQVHQSRRDAHAERTQSQDASQ